MTEESVTKFLLDWLESRGWEIIAFDFPQSGTGIRLHPNDELRTTKNKGVWLPDVVAHTEKTVAFFEDKVDFTLADFQKLESIKVSGDYDTAIETLLDGYQYDRMVYGIGLADTEKNVLKSKEYIDKVDFCLFVGEDGRVRVEKELGGCFVDY